LSRIVLALALVLTLPVCLFAQGPQNLTTEYPYWPVRQTYFNNSSTQSPCHFQSDVRAGNIILVTMSWFSLNQSMTIADTLGTSFNALFTQFNSPNSSGVAVWAGTAPSSGADVVTVTNNQSWQNITCTELLPYWSVTTTDGTAFSAWSGAGGQTTPTVTPTVLHDFVVGVLGGTSNTGVGPTDDANSLGWAEFADTLAVGFKINTALSATHIHVITSGAAGSMATVALQALPLRINSGTVGSPPPIADGALSVPYSYQLLASGGISSYTWSITSGSLQSGLSLNTSTGVISGTPTSSTLNTITFQVTDGTSTVTKTVTLKIGATANTLTVVQSRGANATFASNVTSGNLLMVVLGNGGSFSAFTPSCVDSVGTVYQQVGWTGWEANSGAPSVTGDIMAGFAPSSGANTLTCHDVTVTNIYEISGVSQADTIYGNIVTDGQTLASNPQTITGASITTLVPNELLIAGSAFVRNSSGTSTIQSPWTSVNSTNGGMGTGYQAAATVTSYSISWVCAACTSGDPYAGLIVGVRPGASAPVPPSGRNHSQVIKWTPKSPWNRPRKVIELEKI
jgi:hypothetical protein